MKPFIGVLVTKTKVGCLEHPFVYVALEELKKLSFKEAYDKFIDVIYGEGKAVVCNNKAIVLYKKSAFIASLETVNPPVVLYNDWKKISNLKHEFKQLIGIALPKK